MHTHTNRKAKREMKGEELVDGITSAHIHFCHFEWAREQETDRQREKILQSDCKSMAFPYKDLRDFCQYVEECVCPVFVSWPEISSCIEY